MKSPLAKARDEWLNSEEGRRCCEGTPTGQYLQNRLELAFLAGTNFTEERIKELEAESSLNLEASAKAYTACGNYQEKIKELEKTLDKIRLISGRSYRLPVTSVAAMNNMKIIKQRCEQALKKGD